MEGLAMEVGAPEDILVALAVEEGGAVLDPNQQNQ